jgi:transcription initiation factor TFIIE subunit alpha
MSNLLSRIFGKKKKEKERKIEKKEKIKKDKRKKIPKKVEKPIKVEKKIKKIKKIKPSDLIKDKRVAKLILGIAGKDGIHLYKILSRVDRMDEFELARKLNLEVNVVRSLLYKLYNEKLVEYTKKRDRRKGWWIYIWKIVPERPLYLLKKRRKLKLMRLKEKLEKEKVIQLFQCDKCKLRMSFTKAMQNNFCCPYCGSQLTAVDSSVIVKELEREIAEIEKTLSKK